MKFYAVDPFTGALALWVVLTVGGLTGQGVDQLVQAQKLRPIQEPSALEKAHGFRRDFYEKHEFIDGRWKQKGDGRGSR